MISYKCDKCGIAIPKEDDVVSAELRYGPDTDTDYELCKKCGAKVEAFIEDPTSP